MIRPTDLMLNDWVYTTFQSDDTGTEPVFTTVARRVTDLSKFDIYLQDNAHAGAEITPIPITQEILEENNILLQKRNTEKVYMLDDGTNEIIIRDTLDGMFDCECAKGGPDGMRYVSMRDLRYVHELQHAIKQCNMDIDIFIR